MTPTNPSLLTETVTDTRSILDPLSDQIQASGSTVGHVMLLDYQTFSDFAQSRAGKPNDFAEFQEKLSQSVDALYEHRIPFITAHIDFGLMREFAAAMGQAISIRGDNQKLEMDYIRFLLDGEREQDLLQMVDAVPDPTIAVAEITTSGEQFPAWWAIRLRSPVLLARVSFVPDDNDLNLIRVEIQPHIPMQFIEQAEPFILDIGTRTTAHLLTTGELRPPEGTRFENVALPLNSPVPEHIAVSNVEVEPTFNAVVSTSYPIMLAIGRNDKPGALVRVIWTQDREASPCMDTIHAATAYHEMITGGDRR